MAARVRGHFSPMCRLTNWSSCISQQTVPFSNLHNSLGSINQCSDVFLPPKFLTHEQYYGAVQLYLLCVSRWVYWKAERSFEMFTVCTWDYIIWELIQRADGPYCKGESACVGLTDCLYCVHHVFTVSATVVSGVEVPAFSLMGLFLSLACLLEG